MVSILLKKELKKKLSRYCQKNLRELSENSAKNFDGTGQKFYEHYLKDRTDLKFLSRVKFHIQI